MKKGLGYKLAQKQQQILDLQDLEINWNNPHSFEKYLITDNLPNKEDMDD